MAAKRESDFKYCDWFSVMQKYVVTYKLEDERHKG